MAARSPCGRVAGLGIILGPVIGGWLLEHYWGSIFLINVFVVIVAVVAGAFLVPESKDPKATPLDPLGAVLSIAGLVALVYAIIEAPEAGPIRWWLAPSSWPLSCYRPSSGGRRTPSIRCCS